MDPTDPQGLGSWELSPGRLSPVGPFESFLGVDQDDASILIVDDENTNVQLLRGVLEEAGFSNQHSTTDSTKVLGLMRQYDPDIILLDLHMPFVDGYELMRDLNRVISRETYLPILAVSADAAEDAKLRALSSGAKDFITKPINALELVLRVRTLLEARFLYKALGRHIAVVTGAEEGVALSLRSPFTTAMCRRGTESPDHDH